jgi:hypothetical protein
MTGHAKFRLDARREKRAMQLIREERLLSVFLALPPALRPTVTIVPLRVFLAAAERDARLREYLPPEGYR